MSLGFKNNTKKIKVKLKKTKKFKQISSTNYFENEKQNLDNDQNQYQNRENKGENYIDIIPEKEKSYETTFLQKPVNEKYDISLRAARKLLKNAHNNHVQNLPISNSVWHGVNRVLKKAIYNTNNSNNNDTATENNNDAPIMDVLQRTQQIEQQQQNEFEQYSIREFSNNAQIKNFDNIPFDNMPQSNPENKIQHDYFEQMFQHAQSVPSIVTVMTLPLQISTIFGISYNPLHWNDFCKRLGPWKSYLQFWKSTGYEFINRSFWIQTGQLSSQTTMSNEEIAIYDTHVRLWKHICDNQIQCALILNSNMNLRYVSRHAAILNHAFNDLALHCPHWEFLYIGRNNPNNKENNFGTWGMSDILVKPKNPSNELFAYCITLAGAQRLLQYVYPYKNPINILVAALHDTGILTSAAIYPPLIQQI